MGKVVQRHTTFTTTDDDGNILTANLEPGEELPDWAPDTVVNNELLFQPRDGEEAVIVDEDTGTELFESEVTPVDHTSPTFGAGHEGGTAEATEEERAEAKAARGEAGGYESMDKAQLQALAEERGLAKSGTRQDLIERLQQSDAENS